MKKILLFSIFVFSLTSYSQNKFQNGYIINNDGTKLECLINNLDWRNNPTNFDYKTSENSEVKLGKLKNVLEFGIDNGVKFKRFDVEIDRSSNMTKSLSDVAEAVFKKEAIYLKQILGGEANMFSYKEGNLIRYFYSTNNLEIPKQLVYKKYTVYNEKIGADNVFKNNKFKRQLSSNFKCENFSDGYYNKIEYKEKSLLNFFKEYNNCKGTTSNEFESNVKRKSFNLNIRPSIRSARLNIDGNPYDNQDVELDKKSSFSLGLEAEFVLPFNNGKWSVIIEPTYQSYKNEKDYEFVASTLPITTIASTTTSVEYKSIELPIGLRHYMFLNDNSKLFINAFFALDFNNSDAQVDYSNSSQLDLDIKSRNNFGFGLGYSFNNKYSIEFRQNTTREVLDNYISFSGGYTSSSIILGVNIF